MDIKEALTFDGLKYFYTKYIKPLKTGAFATVVNNATTTVANTVLDGRMGKTLADKDANLQSQINTLNSSLNNADNRLNKCCTIDGLNSVRGIRLQLYKENGKYYLQAIITTNEFEKTVNLSEFAL